MIGSGMGGMSAAALLAKDGFKVFVAEQSSRIGGRCSTLEYNGYKCTSGVLTIEMNGIVQELFEQTGADFNVLPAGALQYLIEGKLFQVPKSGGMKVLLEATGAGQDSIEKIMSAMSRAINWKEPSPGITLFDWIRQYTDHSRIIEVFQTLVKTALMVKVEEVSAQYFFKFIRTVKGANEFGYATEGSAALPQALGQVVLRNGGEIWTDSIVTRILTADGIVQGAVLKHQEREFQIETQVVVSDTGPEKTVELAGKQLFDRDYLQELEAKMDPTAFLCLQIGLEEPLFEQNHLLLTGSKRVYALYQPTKICPDLSPEGKHLLIANAIPDSSGALSSEVDRQMEIDLCFEDIKTCFPKFEKKATTLLTGIFRDYWPGMRSWPGKDMPLKTPIINLYNVGDGVKPSGYSGLPAVVKSGMLVSQEIRQRMAVFAGGAGQQGIVKNSNLLTKQND